jgi:hypothetical protein
MVLDNLTLAFAYIVLGFRLFMQSVKPATTIFTEWAAQSAKRTTR